MSTIKSFSVGNGDVFYIDHNSKNLTIIDCYLPDEETKKRIINEIKIIKLNKEITRFISTHPDQDHISGLKYLDDSIDILNFYCVKNNVNKENATVDFKHYCSLRNSIKTCFLYKGLTRKWMNDFDSERKASGISILWPDVKNERYIEALKQAEEDGNPNNISAIIQYKLENGVTVLWFGDLEADFMESIEDDIRLPKADIIFAPHHGRNTGKMPESWLEQIDPKVIIIGEAPSENLNYYGDRNTITQNTAGDITLECVSEKVHFFASNKNYEIDFLDDEFEDIKDDDIDCGDFYIGTLNL